MHACELCLAPAGSSRVIERKTRLVRHACSRRWHGEPCLAPAGCVWRRQIDVVYCIGMHAQFFLLHIIRVLHISLCLSISPLSFANYPPLLLIRGLHVLPAVEA
jgi:hypothetical protein